VRPANRTGARTAVTFRVHRSVREIITIPHQPRVPRGHPDGGQWTSAGSWSPAELAESGDRVWALSDLTELPAPDLRKPEIPRIPPGTYPEYAQLRKFGPRVRPDVPPPKSNPRIELQ
jgi:hypothetical protein